MTEECDYCGAVSVVPVLDKRIEKAPTAGNKYRTRCTNCWRWAPMTSAGAWESSDRKLVLPSDADPEVEDNLVTNREYGRRDAEEELAEKVSEQGIDDDRLAADGGEDVDDQSGEENVFDCPACGAEVTGYPESCPECEAPYEWEGDE